MLMYQHEYRNIILNHRWNLKHCIWLLSVYIINFSGNLQITPLKISKTEKAFMSITGKFSHGFGLEVAICRGLNDGVILSIFWLHFSLHVAFIQQIDYLHMAEKISTVSPIYNLPAYQFQQVKREKDFSLPVPE